MKRMEVAELAPLARELRTWIIDMLAHAKSGHPGGSLSAIDVITTLFFREMRGVVPGGSEIDRDHFILSKGHAVPALYAVLAKRGFIGFDELKTLRQTGSRLQGHPDRVRLPIVEASTGSLGQGLSVAHGMALGFRMEKKPHRVYCLVGDGEIQEGQIWEAAFSAPKFELSNLCVVLDANNGQIDGPVSQVMPIEPIAEKWRAFGWDVVEVDGHDFTALNLAFENSRKAQESGSKKPTFIVARTVKGKGVSFMENQIGWHGVAPTMDEAERAKKEILSSQKGAK